MWFKTETNQAVTLPGEETSVQTLVHWLQGAIFSIWFAILMHKGQAETLETIFSDC